MDECHKHKVEWQKEARFKEVYSIGLHSYKIQKWEKAIGHSRWRDTSYPWEIAHDWKKAQIVLLI